MGDTGDGTFSPDDAVTGSEAAKMFLCALGYRAALPELSDIMAGGGILSMANVVCIVVGVVAALALDKFNQSVPKED